MVRKKEKASITFLFTTTLISLFLLPFAIAKRPIKDWLIVYLVSSVGNSFIDKILVSRGYLKYKIRPLPSIFKIHLPFDHIYYPLMLLYYNQWTLNSKPIGYILKLFPFVIPQVFIETFAERNTRLISWRRGWTWYHSLISLIIKLLACRGIIGGIRVLNKNGLSFK
ncbi:hypothetical protein EJF36_02755 [Bacillus sp. HMF5848]|nr:hypothetical protein EJF36_02755 [Bacillus sp. HMF5848]